MSRLLWGETRPRDEDIVPGTLDRDSVCIDGRPLDWWGLWLVGLDVGEAKPATSMVSVPGRDGAADLTLDVHGRAALGRRTVSVQLLALGDRWGLIDRKRRLGEVAGREVGVRVAPLGVEFRGRASLSAWEDSVSGARVTLTLDAEPAGYGAERSAQVGASQSAFLVGGNSPTWPTVTATPPASAQTWALTLDGAAFEVADVTFDGLKELVIDMGASTCRYGGALVTPTLQSDYADLAPGPHAAKVSAGTARVGWRERWVV